jgi:hypothetical protein
MTRIGPPSLHDQHEIAADLKKLYRLQALDSVWTSYLDSRDAIPDSDIPTLRTIADEMDALLAECVAIVDRSLRRFGNDGKLIEDSVLELTRRLGETQRTKWQRFLDQNGGAARLFMDSMQPQRERWHCGKDASD